MSDAQKIEAPVLRKAKQERPGDPEYYFYCPACNFSHWFKTTGAEPLWEFDGDMEKPTVKPSIRVRSGRYVDGKHAKEECCHFFIVKGEIRYCLDCTHDFAGRKVKMVPTWSGDA